MMMIIIFEKLQSLFKEFLSLLPLIGITAFILCVTYFIAKFAVKFLGHSLRSLHLRYSAIEVLKKLLSVSIWMGAFLIVSPILFPSITVAHVFTALGLGTVAFGFAFKDILENFMAGILLLLRENFLIDDVINCQNYEGKVEKITIRETYIRRSDGEQVILPNAFLFKNPITVKKSEDEEQISIIVTIDKKYRPNEVKEIIYDALSKFIAKEKIAISAQKFSLTGIEYKITWFLEKRINSDLSKHEVIDSIQKTLSDANITLV